MVEQKTRLEAFKDVCHKWLVIENDEYIDVVFGVVFAIRLDAIPVWLFLVAPPSGGKTVILLCLEDHNSIYLLTTLTENTLISGKITEPGEPDPSLLPKLDGKVLVFKDFTVCLTGKPDKVKEVFGQLRDAYDGQSRKGFGTGKDTKYKAKFGIIAAVTNEIDRHLGILSPLGERFLVYRFPSLSDTETEARTLKAADNESVTEQEEELKRAAHQILDLPTKPAKISKELKEKLARIAHFVAVGRTAFRRDGNTKEIESLPQPEVPTRIVKQLVSLAVGIAMAREKEQVTEDEIRLVHKVALGSVFPTRLDVLRCLKVVYPNSLTVKDLTGKIKLGENVIRRCLDDLYILGVVEKGKENNPVTTPDKWKLKDKYKDMLQ